MKKSPEQIVLAVALGLFALTAGFLAFTFPSLQDITNVPSTSPTGKVPAKISADELDASLADWTSPTIWQMSSDRSRLFLSDGFLFYPTLYPGGNYLQKNDGTARTPGGVLISWYQKYGLDFTDPNIDREDLDNDGFSNVVEFKNGIVDAKDADGSQSTNPLDPLSHPTYLSRLRLEKYDSRPFRMQFRGYQLLNGVYYFQIYLKDVPSYEQPRLKKTGDDLGFEGYKVGVFHLNIVNKEDPATHIVTPVDLSTLELTKPDIDFSIVLPFRQEIDSPESTANFVMLMPSEINNVMKVERGKTFTPPFLTGQTFIVIEANDSGAIIRDLKAGTDAKQNITIPKLNPKEWDEVPIPPASKKP